jgi:GNAT superfamily N-acetyltransferase
MTLLEGDIDVLTLRDGRALAVRPVRDADAAALQDYFHRLSEASRYSRMLGATRELPPQELYRVLHGDRDHLSLIVTTARAGFEQIVGEARLAHDAAADEVEISLSVADDCQRSGAGGALFDHLQRLAVGFGTVEMYGDTLRSNAAMVALARSRGFALIPTPGDWRLVRFHKAVGQDQPLSVAAKNPLILNTGFSRMLAAHGVKTVLSVLERTRG